MSMKSVRLCRSGNGRRVLRRILVAALPALALSFTVMQASLADDHGWHGDRHDRHDDRRGDWHGDIRHFHDRDFDHWRAGRWYHGRHTGRLGWWWIVGGTWYFYPAPVYPYPNPYLPPTVAPPPAAAPVWYYCANPPGYYPYVPQCAAPWQAVPAQ